MRTCRGWEGSKRAAMALPSFRVIRMSSSPRVTMASVALRSLRVAEASNFRRRRRSLRLAFFAARHSKCRAVAASSSCSALAPFSEAGYKGRLSGRISASVLDLWQVDKRSH